MTTERSDVITQSAAIVRFWGWLRQIWIDLCWLFGLLPGIVKFGSVLLLKSLAVSFLLALLSTPATAIYATRMGIRVPIEGVPYVNFTIALWSFIGFALSIVTVSLTVAILIYVRNGISIVFGLGFEIEVKVGSNGKIDVGGVEIEVTGFDKFVLSASVFLFAISMFAFIFHSLGLSGRFGIRPDVVFNWVLGGLAASVASFAIWYAKKALPLWMLQGYLTLPLLIVMAVSLFASDTYGSLLRIIRYGGGIATSIQLNDLQNREVSQIDGYLLLRSDTSLFMFSKTGKSVVEIPASQVSLITTNFDADWMVPNFGVLNQTKYIRID